MRRPSLARRLRVYQAERFPIAQYAVLVAALAAGGLGFAVWQTGAGYGPMRFLVVWLTALGVFFQLRVADEHKDFVADSRYRPYRPVPRGVIDLAELALLGRGVAGLQLLVNLLYDPRLLMPLAGVWLYLWLMGREFFAHAWLAARPLFYMLSHMVILALLFVYILWAGYLDAAPETWRGAAWFVAAGYANGVVFEIGRKVRAPADEEPGVATYSALWGITPAAAAWAAAVATAAAALTLAGWSLPRGTWLAAWLWAWALGGGWVAWRYARQQDARWAKRMDAFSAVWALAVYGALAALPWLA